MTGMLTSSPQYWGLKQQLSEEWDECSLSLRESRGVQYSCELWEGEREPQSQGRGLRGGGGGGEGGGGGGGGEGEIKPQQNLSVCSSAV